MNTAILSSRTLQSRSTPRASMGWKINTFLITRREDRDVPPYRSVVFTPFAESADLGVGLSPDELARRATPSFVDGIGAARKVRPDEIADFWENAAVTVRGGGTESVALSRATRMASTPRMRGVLGTVRWRLNQGIPLHSALAEFPMVFSRAHCALAEAATELPPDERSALYASLAKTLREEASRGRRFIMAMLDQIITAVMLLGLVLITVIYFVPNFAAMFRGMDLDLPWPYRVALSINQWTVHFAWLVFPSLILGSVLIWKLCREALRNRFTQHLLARSWAVGPVIRNLALSRSLPLFAVLHKAGVHPETIFRLAGESSGNALVEDFFKAAYRRCASGMEMEKAFLSERARLGLEEGRRLSGKVEAGGEVGDMEGVLRGLSEEFSERANAKIDALPKVVKPLNLMLMGLVIGMIAALVGLPSMLVLEKTFQQQNALAKPRFHSQSTNAGK